MPATHYKVHNRSDERYLVVTSGAPRFTFDPDGATVFVTRSEADAARGALGVGWHTKQVSA